MKKIFTYLALVLVISSINNTSPQDKPLLSFEDLLILSEENPKMKNKARTFATISIYSGAFTLIKVFLLKHLLLKTANLFTLL